MRSLRFGRCLVSLVTGAGLLACGSKESTPLAPLEPDSLSFRVLVDGQPLVDAEVQVTEESWSEASPGTRSGSNGPRRTDAEGRLALEHYSLEWLDPVQLEVTIVHGERFGKIRTTQAPGNATAADLALEPMPTLTAGRVVDPEGKVVSGAEVIVVDDSRRNSPRGVTDDHGEFALRVPGEFGPPDQRLFARHGERLSPLVPVVVGAQDVVLVLSSATGGLTGRVLLDPEVPPEHVTVQLYADELGSLQTGRGLFELDTELSEDGTFTLVGRVPGRHRARILADSHELLSIDDVEVRPGSPGHDPRLDPLDLRGKLHVRRVRLVPPEGQVVTSGSYLAYPSGEREGFYAPIDGSELRIISPYPSPTVEIRATGYRSVRLEELSEDRTVDLQPGWPVRLVLDDDVRLPEPPVAWSLELHGVGPQFGVNSPSVRFEPGRRDVQLIATDLGEYEVRWRRGPSNDPPMPCGFGGQRGWPRQTIHVHDFPEEQVLRLGWVPVAP